MATIYSYTIDDIMTKYIKYNNNIRISKLFPFITKGTNLLMGLPFTGKTMLEEIMGIRIAVERKEPVAIISQDIKPVLTNYISSIYNNNKEAVAKNKNNPYLIDFVTNLKIINKYVKIYSVWDLENNHITTADFIDKYGDDFCCIFTDDVFLFVKHDSSLIRGMERRFRELNGILASKKHLQSIVTVMHELRYPKYRMSLYNARRVIDNYTYSLMSLNTHMLLRDCFGMFGSHRCPPAVGRYYNASLLVRSNLFVNGDEIYRFNLHKGYIDDMYKLDASKSMSSKDKLSVYNAVSMLLDEKRRTTIRNIKRYAHIKDNKVISKALKQLIKEDIIAEDAGQYYIKL